MVFAVLIGGWVMAYRSDGSAGGDTTAGTAPETALVVAARQEEPPSGRAQQLENAATAALRPEVFTGSDEAQDGVKAKTLPDPAAPTTQQATTTTAKPTTSTTRKPTTSTSRVATTAGTTDPGNTDGWVDSGNGVMMPPVLLRVRKCESHDNYKAVNSSSGAGGAYQFLASSWRSYGYAAKYGVSRAELATPAQQDEAAVATWQRSGTSPWSPSRSCWS